MLMTKCRRSRRSGLVGAGGAAAVVGVGMAGSAAGGVARGSFELLLSAGAVGVIPCSIALLMAADTIFIQPARKPVDYCVASLRELRYTLFFGRGIVLRLLLTWKEFPMTSCHR